MKIGVTINVGRSSIWANGVNQNAIYLSMLLKACGHDSNLIYYISETNKTEEVINEIPSGVNGIEIEESYTQKFDVIIQAGLTIESHMMDRWKAKNKDLKYVAYECGNHFFIDSEKILYNAFNPGSLKNFHTPIPDQVWVIPQHENSCLAYFKFRKQCQRGTVVPFTWNPMLIEKYFKEKQYKTYQPRDIQKVAVMEPNFSLIKNCIFPIVSLEKYINEYDKLNKVYLIGGTRIKDNEEFKNLIRHTSLLKNNILTAEPRISTGKVIHNHADVVLSWQWENNLNYLYFDVAWMGWPIIHNANLCKDVGYYYETFDDEGTCEALNNVIKKHNKDKGYLDRMRSIIDRYTINNKQLILDYNNLLDDLISNRFIKRTYNWRTNSIS